MEPKPKFIFDENLRDVPEDFEALRTHVRELRAQLDTISDLDQRAGLLGDIGTYMRCLGELDIAENVLKEALQLIAMHGLGIRREIQQKIRLANVLQWQKSFDESNRLFTEIVEICRENQDAGVYLDFALQHAGKNYFDQGDYTQALGLFEEALAIRKSRSAPIDLISSTELAIKRTRERLNRPPH